MHENDFIYTSFLENINGLEKYCLLGEMGYNVPKKEITENNIYFSY